MMISKMTEVEKGGTFQSLLSHYYREEVGRMMFGKDSLENVVLTECISVDGITDKLRNILHSKVQKPQLPFVSNFHKFRKAVEIVMEPKNDITLG